MATKEKSKGLARAIKAAGSVAKLATALQVTRQTVYYWADVPAERVVDMEKATGVPREELRPDLYR